MHWLVPGEILTWPRASCRGHSLNPQRDATSPYQDRWRDQKDLWLLVTSVDQNLEELGPSHTAGKRKMGMLESHKIPVLGRLRRRIAVS